MKKDDFIDLMAKQLLGNDDPEIRQRIENAIADDPKLKSLKDEMERQWQTAGKLVLDIQLDTERSWEDFKVQRSNQPKVISLWPNIMKVAAVLVMGLALAFYFINQAEDPLIEYATGPQETRTIELSDGSKLWLNESTSISVNSDFGDKDRKVTLRGEAYFEIARDENRPFIISTDHTVTQVLGTSFNIKNREGKDEISVVSGKVSFSAGAEQLILTKDMAAQFDDSGSQLKRITSSENSLSWQTKKLVFNNVPLKEVFDEMEKYFNTEIRTETTAIETCLFKGTFEDPTIDDVFKIISLTMNITYSKTNTGYLIKGQGCSDR